MIQASTLYIHPDASLDKSAISLAGNSPDNAGENKEHTGTATAPAISFDDILQNERSTNLTDVEIIHAPTYAPDIVPFSYTSNGNFEQINQITSEPNIIRSNKDFTDPLLNSQHQQVTTPQNANRHISFSSPLPQQTAFQNLTIPSSHVKITFSSGHETPISGNISLPENAFDNEISATFNRTILPEALSFSSTTNILTDKTLITSTLLPQEGPQSFFDSAITAQTDSLVHTPESTIPFEQITQRTEPAITGTSRIFTTSITTPQDGQASISSFTTEEDGSIELRLDPPELGRIKIQFETIGTERLVAQVTGERAETLQLLRNNSELLRQFLNEQGFEHVDLGLSDWTASSHEQSSQQQTTAQYVALEEQAQDTIAPLSSRTIRSDTRINLTL